LGSRSLHVDPAEAVPAVGADTVATLAAELGRSPRAIRDAIARGELAAVKRGRGYVIGVNAVAAWTQAPASARSRPGAMARA
jgi:Helix-turn-helix domain